MYRFRRKRGTRFNRRRPRYNRRRTARYSKKRFMLGKSYRPTAIPTRCYCKLKYAEYGSFSFGSGTIGYAYQYCTSMFDPRYDTGGHQPLFFDQYAAMYKSYIVYGIKYKFTFISTFDYGATVYVVYRTDATKDSDQQVIMEKTNRTIRRGLQQTGPMVTKGYVSVASAYGVKRSVVRTDDKFKSLVGGSPTNMVYITPIVAQYHPSLAKDSVVHTEITYYCEFLDRQDVAAS